MGLHWENLTKPERAEYMRLQMSPSYSHYDRSGYLPEDVGECGACCNYIIGSGWCKDCLRRWCELRKILECDEHDYQPTFGE